MDASHYSLPVGLYVGRLLGHYVARSRRGNAMVVFKAVVLEHVKRGEAVVMPAPPVASVYVVLNVFAFEVLRPLGYSANTFDELAEGGWQSAGKDVSLRLSYAEWGDGEFRPTWAFSQPPSMLASPVVRLPKVRLSSCSTMVVADPPCPQPQYGCAFLTLVTAALGIYHVVSRLL